MLSARGLALATTSLMPSAVSLKSSAVKCARASSRLAAWTIVQLKIAASANTRAARPARQKRIVVRARQHVDAGRRGFAFPHVLPHRRWLGSGTALFGAGVVVAAS